MWLRRVGQIANGCPHLAPLPLWASCDHRTVKFSWSDSTVVERQQETFSNPDSFKGLEYAGWQKGAAAYDDLLGSVTRFAIVPLLDATDVRAGSQVLALCCGLG